MINQTNHNSFEPFGSIYTEPVDIAKLNLTRREITSSSPKITDLFVFPCEVCIECPPGLSRLLIASSPDMDDVKTFAVRNNLRLKPNTYFNLIPLSTPLVWYIITPREIPGQSADLSVPYTYQPVSAPFHVRRILAAGLPIRPNTAVSQKCPINLMKCFMSMKGVSRFLCQREPLRFSPMI